MIAHKPYQPRHTARSRFLDRAGWRHHVLEWGEPTPGQAPLVLLHGWMDVAASFQFMVDQLQAARWVIAPDWRGFGHTAPLDPRARPETYWFADYLADLDALLDTLGLGEGAPGGPVDLLGHSMGGNVAMLYAGIRPAAVRRLVNLEGFGLPASRAAQAPGRYAHWLDAIKALRRGGLDLRDYDSADAVAERLRRNNPRLDAARAQWLATHWAQAEANGRWRILGEAAHKLPSAQIYRLDEALEVYRRISAPLLFVRAQDDSMAAFWKGQYTQDEHDERLRAVPQVQRAVIDGAGHMLHHDQPAELARILEAFLA